MAGSRVSAKTSSKSSAVESLLRREKRKSTVPNNPFSKVASVPKRHLVLGRRIKGAERNVTAARTKAIHSRLQSLHDEFNRKHNNKTNRFLDNRFGQFNSSLTAEQKGQIRFEQERRKRKELFNLDDDNADADNEMTHFGASLSSVLADEYDEKLEADHELEGQIERDRELMAEEARRGAPRTRQEILQEIIMKSKERKAEAALAKEQDAAMLADLDSAWSQLRSHMIYSKHDDHDDQLSEHGSSDSSSDHEFEMISRQLANQSTGAATDRTLTEAEAAAQVRQKLDQLEQERLKRMSRPTSQDQGRRSVEDLTACNADIDPEFVLQDSDPDLSDVDLSDLDPDHLQLSDSAGPDPTHCTLNDHDLSDSGQQQLPFIISVPDHVQDLIDLARSDADRLSTVIERIRACNHVSLHPDNSIALQRFFRMLLQYLRSLWSDSAPSPSNAVELSQILTSNIGEMASQFPRLASDSLLQNIISRIESCLNPLTDLPTHTLIELQLAMQIFSISDYVHACITPVLFAVTSYLSRLQIYGRTMTCLPRSVLLCDILLQYVQKSNRFIPELINHLILCMGRILRQPPHHGTTLSLNCLFDRDARVPFHAFLPIFECALSLHQHLPSFPELMMPFADLLNQIEDKAAHDRLLAMIHVNTTRRMPLVITKDPHKIRELDPVVYEDFVPGKAREQDAEKRHQKALLRKLKGEKKGARRELRRDAQFIENERRRLIEKKCLQRIEKLKETRTFVENLQRDTNALRLCKRKKR